MRRERRLTGSKRFSFVLREGRGWGTRLMALKMVPNDLARSRFGFLVSKRIGSAVVRNTVKRRLREAIRLSSVIAGWDIVCIARRGAATADYHQLKRAADDLLTRSRLLSSLASPLHTPTDGGEFHQPPSKAVLQAQEELASPTSRLGASN